MDGVYLDLSKAFDIVFYDILSEKVTSMCGEVSSVGVSRAICIVRGGTKAIWKKLLQCTPGFSAGAPAIEHLC